ncbi:hypothetical protein GCM10010442_77770 [Kitasatospora kifunensis]
MASAGVLAVGSGAGRGAGISGRSGEVGVSGAGGVRAGGTVIGGSGWSDALLVGLVAPMVPVAFGRRFGRVPWGGAAGGVQLADGWGD